jgi:hypothetical protein
MLMRVCYGHRAGLKNVCWVRKAASPFKSFLLTGKLKMTNRLIQFIALCMLGLFFLPYVWKLKQFDLLAILILGMVLPIVDFITSREKSK